MIAITSAEDARFIADNLGDDEICVRLYGREEASRLAYHVATTSPLSWVVYTTDAKPAAMFGAYPDDSGEFGWAWLLCAADARKAARALIIGGRLAVAISRSYWPELRVEAEPRSERQKLFLQHMGFTPRITEMRDGEEWTEMVQ